ncbi:MAG: HEPN domain-containing protein [Candidatus Altiarchaeota archaeon]
MEKLDFLGKIGEDGKLQVVETSDDIKDAHLKKSESYLSSSKILRDNDKLEEAVSIAYYSMYYSALALLFKAGIKSENHTATIIVLHDVFGLDSTDLQQAKRERVDKQYYIDFKITKDDTKRLITKAERFNARIYDFIQKLTNEDIDRYRQKVKGMIDTNK